MNRVCAIHNEYCPDGNCRWCEVPATDGPGLFSALPIFIYASPMGIDNPPSILATHKPYKSPSTAEIIDGAIETFWAPGGVTGSPL